jgi:aryl-alcohol dehydrogenase
MSVNGSPVFGNFFGQSSFAQHVIVAETNAVPVSADCDLTVMAPFGCGVMTGAGAVFSTLALSDRDSLAVFGAGGVGLPAVMAAKAQGVSTIVVVDPIASRRDIALEIGATHVFDPHVDDPVSAIRDVTGGGAVASLETSARADVVIQALDCLAAMGTCVALGFGTPEFPFTLSQVGRGRRLTSTNVGESDPHLMLPRLVEMHRTGQLPVEKLISRYPFEDFERAVADAESGAAIKPVLTFSA